MAIMTTAAPPTAMPTIAPIESELGGLLETVELDDVEEPEKKKKMQQSPLLNALL